VRPVRTDYIFNPTVFTLSSGIGRNLAKTHVLDIDNWITGITG
jgi:hypothetical protein